MKPIYSLILLLSFIIGVLQPVMPMVEYVVTEINLTKLFDSSDAMSSCSTADSNPDMDKITEFCECCETDNNEKESLLDTDFYPIPLHTIQYIGHHALTVTSENNVFIDEQILSDYYSTLSPPPRHA
jgi:hypothetical protein